VPTKLRADHIPFHTVNPLFTSEHILGLGEAVSDKKTLFRHSRALMCTALSAEVVGGCIEGEASGGKESVVGWTRASSGDTRDVRKERLELSVVVVSGSVFISTSTLSPASMSSSGKQENIRQ
jgi:hypothetical protein